MNGIVIHHVHCYNYLNITLDSNTTLSPMLAKDKKIVSKNIYSQAKIRSTIDMKCALTIYKQTTLPLLNYSGFMSISVNISDRHNLQVLQ